MLTKLTGLIGCNRHAFVDPFRSLVEGNKFTRLFCSTTGISYQDYIIERLDEKRGGDSWRRYVITKNPAKEKEETNPPEYVKVNGASDKPVVPDDIKKPKPVPKALVGITEKFFSIMPVDSGFEVCKE